MTSPHSRPSVRGRDLVLSFIKTTATRSVVPFEIQEGLTLRESIVRYQRKVQETKYADLSNYRSGRHFCSSLGPPILYQQIMQWGITFYTRIDLKGSFHTYPHVGGPFQSLAEANDAIENYLHSRRDEKMLVGLSPVDVAVQHCLYWPDGKRKKHLRSQPIDTSRDSELQLVEALVDKYNDDHDLLGDLAYEFKAVVCCQLIRMGDKFYDHINFTAKTKGGADDVNCCIDKLFFAEVMRNQPFGELSVISLCMLDPTDDGSFCYGCSDDMKHPIDAYSYIAGHTSFSSGVPNKRRDLHDFDEEDNEEELEAEKARLRSIVGEGEMKQMQTFIVEGCPREAKRMRTLTLEGQGEVCYERHGTSHGEAKKW